MPTPVTLDRAAEQVAPVGVGAAAEEEHAALLPGAERHDGVLALLAGQLDGDAHRVASLDRLGATVRLAPRADLVVPPLAVEPDQVDLRRLVEPHPLLGELADEIAEIALVVELAEADGLGKVRRRVGRDNDRLHHPADERRRRGGLLAHDLLDRELALAAEHRTCDLRTTHDIEECFGLAEGPVIVLSHRVSFQAESPKSLLPLPGAQVSCLMRRAFVPLANK